MSQATITFPDDLFRQAELKASSEGVTVSQVVRRLLAQWLVGEVVLGEAASARQTAVDRAMRSFGMWNDRDPDEFLRRSRAGLEGRDQGLEDARLDV